MSTRLGQQSAAGGSWISHAVIEGACPIHEIAGRLHILTVGPPVPHGFLIALLEDIRIRGAVAGARGRGRAVAGACQRGRGHSE